MPCEGGDDLAQFPLVLWQRFVQQFLALAVEGDRVMVALAHVNADEDINKMVLFDHAASRHQSSTSAGMSCGGRVRHPRYGRPAVVKASAGLVPISDPLAPIGPR